MRVVTLMVLSLGFAVSAQAETRSGSESQDAPRADADRVGYADAPVEVKLADGEMLESRDRPHCLREAGTRIRRAEQQRCERPGRRYSRQELERRGEIDIGETLSKLDPAITGGKQW